MIIYIIGVSGSGKSTLASSLSNHFDYPYLDIDSIAFKPNSNFTLRSKSEIINDYLQFKNDHKNFILTGTFKNIFDNKLYEDADLIIYLKVGFLKNMYRISKRTLKRALSREDVHNQGPERFFKKDNMIYFTLSNYRQKTKTFKQEILKYNGYTYKNKKQKQQLINLICEIKEETNA